MAYLPEIERVTVEGLKKALDSGESVQLVDLRNPTDYGSSDVKLPGAVRIAFDELEQRYVELETTRQIVTYCT